MSDTKPKVYCFYSKDQVDSNNFGDADLFVHIDEYKTIERALLIEASEPIERAQEASHYNWLDDQNQKLRADLDLAIEALKWYSRSDLVMRELGVEESEVEIGGLAQETLAKLQERK